METCNLSNISFPTRIELLGLEKFGTKPNVSYYRLDSIAADKSFNLTFERSMFNGTLDKNFIRFDRFYKLPRRCIFY